MAEQMELSDILDDKKNEPPQKVEVVEKPEAEKEKVDHSADYKGKRQQHLAKEYAAQGRDPETGQFVAKDAEAKAEEKPAEKPEAKAEPKPEEKKAEEPKAEKPPAQEFTDKEKAFLKGMEEERRKRQAMERELAEIRAKVTAPQQEAKGFWDDPEAALKRHQDEIRMATMNARLQTAEMIARSKYADFDEKISVFHELTQQTPGLASQMLAAPDPAEFAYRTGKNHKELREAGDLESLRAKIERETEARVRAKIEQELNAKAEEARKQREALVPSLSDVRGGAPQQRPVWNGPPSLDDILK